jgi:hypothetical protein
VGSDSKSDFEAVRRAGHAARPALGGIAASPAGAYFSALFGLPPRCQPRLGDDIMGKIVVPATGQATQKGRRAWQAPT